MMGRDLSSFHRDMPSLPRVLFSAASSPSRPPNAHSTTDHPTPILDFGRAMAALYIGGMGARDRNFYNRLACRYGYEAEAKEIQDLYLDGKKQEAAAAVPAARRGAWAAVGPRG